MRYIAHLTALYLRDGENLQSLLAGAVLPTLHAHIICKNWNIYGLCWKDYKRKKLAHSHPPPDVSGTVTGPLKTARGG